MQNRANEVILAAKDLKYRPSSTGGTYSQPATPHCLQYTKWAQGVFKIAGGVWEEFYYLVIWGS